MSRFEIKAKDGLSRLGIFTTTHGKVSTPLFMPVVHPAKSVISPISLVEEFGFQMVITNSYIINSKEKFKAKALDEGVHGLLGFDGPIMTDSGTFQMYIHELPEEEIDPLEIVRFQREIGSDIGTILDVFSDPKVGRLKVEQDMELSLERAQMSVAEKGEMLLAGTVQGGVYPDLREKSASALASMDLDVHPIGGVVPLMERYRYADVVRAVLASKKHLPVDRPVHLFGCGHPVFFSIAALLGCDFFDSASYAKFAESGRMLLPSGTVHLEQLRELPCECPVCSTTTVDELRSLSKDEQELALMKHNLYIIAAEMRRVRNAISEGKLLELASARARSHPSLYEALQVLMDSYDQIEQMDPVADGTSIFYTGPETARHPALIRFHKKLMDRYPYRKTETLVMIPSSGSRPFSDTDPTIISEARKRRPEELILLFVTPMGAIPWELEHVHPAQQCLFPDRIDEFTMQSAQKRLQQFIDSISFKSGVWLSRDAPADRLLEGINALVSIDRVTSASGVKEKLPEPESEIEDWTIRKMNALLSVQWGITQVSRMNVDSMDFTFSRATGKIRHVSRDGEILFTVVPSTGLLTPTYKGGLEILSVGVHEDYIVKMDEDAAEFVAKGKSALAKFVAHASSELRAGEEVLVVDTEGDLLGVGKAILSGSEMMAFNRGVAVAIRHSKRP